MNKMVIVGAVRCDIGGILMLVSWQCSCGNTTVTPDHVCCLRRLVLNLCFEVVLAQGW